MKKGSGTISRAEWSSRICTKRKRILRQAETLAKYPITCPFIFFLFCVFLFLFPLWFTLYGRVLSLLSPLFSNKRILFTYLSYSNFTLVVFLLFVYHEIPNSAMVNKSFFTLFLLLNLYLFMVYSTLPAFERSISVLLIIFFVSPAEISSPI